jgi:DNA-binding NarL/FixJ family response regulator
MNEILSLNNVTKSFQHKTAVNNVSFSIAIRRVMAGKRVFSTELTFHVIREENPMSPKEQEILRLAALGKTIKEITSELYLSSGTVRNYISEIIHKLGAKNRTEAASIAEKKGWI